MSSSRKLTRLPEKYEPGFLREMDRRTELHKRLSERYETIVMDAGGMESIAVVKLSLIERFVFLEAMLQTWEARIVESPKAEEALASRWTQAINTLQGLAQKIGLERLAPRTVDLKTYLKERAS